MNGAVLNVEGIHEIETLKITDCYYSDKILNVLNVLKSVNVKNILLFSCRISNILLNKLDNYNNVKIESSTIEYGLEEKVNFMEEIIKQANILNEKIEFMKNNFDKINFDEMNNLNKMLHEINKNPYINPILANYECNRFYYVDDKNPEIFEDFESSDDLDLFEI